MCHFALIKKVNCIKNPEDQGCNSLDKELVWHVQCPGLDPHIPEPGR